MENNYGAAPKSQQETLRSDNLLGVVAALVRWRRFLLAAVVSAAVGTAVVSLLFLDDYYKSTSIFYVASPDLFKPEQISGTSQKDMEYYGTEDDIDRALTIATSGEVEEYLIQKFDLYRHYKIDSTAVRASFRVREALEKLYEVTKNKHNAIELSVEDTDKKIAAAMANAARDKTDEIAQRLIKESQSNLVQTLSRSIAEKEIRVKQLSDTLSNLQKRYGIFDVETQTEGITTISAQAQSNLIRSKAKYEQLAKTQGISQDTLNQIAANIKGYEAEFKQTTSKLDLYGQGMNQVSQYAQMFRLERERLSSDRERLTQLSTAFGSKISALHLIETAKVSVQKSRPKRVLIILSAAFITLLFSVLAVLVLDNYRDVNWKDLTQ